MPLHGSAVDPQSVAAATAATAGFGGITTLTDSSGLSGSHDDTVAAMAAIVTLTDNTGQSGSHDDTLAAQSVPADITGGESPTEAEHNAALAAMRVIAQNVSDVAQKVIELVTRSAVEAQNISDVTQKIIEILATTTNVTKFNELLTALKRKDVNAVRGQS